MNKSCHAGIHLPVKIEYPHPQNFTKITGQRIFNIVPQSLCEQRNENETIIPSILNDILRYKDRCSRGDTLVG